MVRFCTLREVEVSTLKARHLVAVRDPNATHDGVTPFRLGLLGEAEGDVFDIGQDGPAGQALPYLYLSSGETRYEIDLTEGELTVATTLADGRRQAVTYCIDVSAMKGQSVQPGQPVTVVFLYNERSVDETAPVDEWLATTGPQYGADLPDRLKITSELVAEFQQAAHIAEIEGRAGRATRAPRTAEPLGANAERSNAVSTSPARAETASPLPGLIDLSSAPAEASAAPVDVDEEIDLRDAPDPEPVLIHDPLTGETYLGRTWRRSRQRTSYRDMRDAGYRVAVLSLHNGQSATVVLQHPRGLPAMQLTTRNGTTAQFLTAEAWDVVIEPGARHQVQVAGPIGSEPVAGDVITTAPIDRLDGTGPALEPGQTADYEASNALVDFRARSADLDERRRRTSGRSLSRSA